LLSQSLTKHEWSNFWLSHSLLLAGRFEEARAEAADTLVVYSDLGQRRELAYSTAILGQCHQHLGDYQAARVHAREALGLAESVGFPRGVGMSLGLLGAIALAEADYEEACTQCEASLTVWQQSFGHPSEFEGELACLALAASGIGHGDEAWDHLRAQLTWAQESQMLMPGLFGLVGATRLLADVGEIEPAVQFYALAAQNPFVANSRWFEDVAGSQITALAATLPGAVVATARERGLARDLDGTVGEILSEMRN
jgi:tetratricopeptide (TPR) repeat protein